MQGAVLGGKYRLLAQLGSGGMGAVYDAEHLVTHGRVAVKVILDTRSHTTEMLGRFQLEARAAATIVSRHIVKVFDVGVDEATNVPFMVMERLEGTDVQRVLAREKMLTEDVVKKIALQVCYGLGAAHKAGVVHRDIKPANLFLAHQDAGDFCVKVLDFGVAKLRANDLDDPTTEALTKTGMMVGSPQYMSPEQARGSKALDARSDLWSLGVTLYQMVSGRLPHERATLGDLILSICSSPATSLLEVAPWVSRDFARVIQRALRRSPNDRFQSAEEFAEAVRATLVDRGSVRPEHLRSPSQVEIEAVLGSNAQLPPSLSPADVATGGSETQSAHTANLSGETLEKAKRKNAPVRSWSLITLAAATLGVFGVATASLKMTAGRSDVPSSALAGPAVTGVTHAPVALPRVDPLATPAASMTEGARPSNEVVRAPSAPAGTPVTKPFAKPAPAGTAMATAVPKSTAPAPVNRSNAAAPKPLVRPLDKFD